MPVPSYEVEQIATQVVLKALASMLYHIEHGKSYPEALDIAIKVGQMRLEELLSEHSVSRGD